MRISTIILFSVSLFQIYRILDLQINKNFFIKKYALSQYNKNIVKVTERAAILDRNNIPIVFSKEIISSFCNPCSGVSIKTLDFIKNNYPQIIDKINRNKKLKFCFIERKVDDKFIKKFLKYEIKDIFFIKNYERVPLFKELIPLIGLVDIDMNGISGLEYYFDKKIKMEKDSVFFNKIDFTLKDKNNNSINNINAKNRALNLTIDAILSTKINKLLKNIVDQNQSVYSTAIVMDSKNGDIICMTQYPFYNRSQKDCDIKFLKPLAITESHEMGSIMKAFCMLAALDENIIEENDLIDCRNTKHTKIKGFDVNTWKAHGIITFKEVIHGSNNIGIAQVAINLGENLYKHYLRLNFGEKTGIELPGESSGYINPPSKWSRQSILSLSYGYEISATLLQLVSAWSVFSSIGDIVKPRIIKDTEIRKITNVYSKNIIEKARSILQYDKLRLPKLFNEDFGDYKIFAKTGTANILENGIYNPMKNTYVVVGHVEKDDYKRIIGVYVYLSNRSDIYASNIALPLFLEVSRELILSRYKEK
jgi:cell division protein FtsI (penicillin-binding protein 3)